MKFSQEPSLKIPGIGKGPEYSSSPLVNRKQMVSEAAYFLSQRRGFTPGYELNDWLQAERQIDSQLSGH
jgi:Protein of unknown function (DUF2934)